MQNIFYTRAKTKMRLGKIEKHILWWAYHQGRFGGRYMSTKSAALLNYAREYYDGRMPRHTHNVRAHCDEKLYKKLHVSFSRALKSLAEKGLIKHQYDPKSEGCNWNGDVFGVPFSVYCPIIAVHSKRKKRDRVIRKSVFRLTIQGIEIGWKLESERRIKNRD